LDLFTSLIHGAQVGLEIRWPTVVPVKRWLLDRLRRRDARSRNQKCIGWMAARIL